MQLQCKPKEVNPRVIATIEAKLNSGTELYGTELYYCSGQNHKDRLYIGPDYQKPILELDMIQEQLKLITPSSVITFLESIGYTIKKEVCGECHHQVMDGMAPQT